MTKKSDLEAPVESAIPFNPCSNGEYLPLVSTPRAQQAQQIWRQLVEEKHRRLGMSRRQFAESACGLATSLFVINQLACDDNARSSGVADSGHLAGGGSGGTSPVGGSLDAYYDVSPEMMEDAACAEDRLYAPDEFVFDVQTHPSTPLDAWPDRAPSEVALDFIKQIFVQGGTSVACITGIPAARDLGVDNVIARTQLREILQRIGGDRLRIHANVAFQGNVAAELEYMEKVDSAYDIGAWKVYPYDKPWLANQEQGLAFADKARSLGVTVIAAHRGIAGNGDYFHAGSPRDLVEAAKQNPDLKYLCYHSGWESGRREDHPYDEAAAAQQTFGIDRLVRAVSEFQIPRNTGNVYAELGSTWHNLRSRPEEAAHALGKLLLAVGENRILFGTDSVFNGTPFGQIAALRAFQIPETLRRQYGYPEITPEIRRKILGLNAAPIYGVDPTRPRCEFGDDEVNALKLAWQHDRRAVPMPHPHRYLGPRTRREFLAFVRNEQRQNESV